MTKRALITGITGQDGAYLAQLLLDKGYEVHGALRRSASVNLWRLHELGIVDQVETVPMEVLELTNIVRALERVEPDEVYHLAAQSFVGLSFDQPIYTTDVNAVGTARVLEAMRSLGTDAKFYQASTSEMFGKAREVPQTETTPFHPRSPYAVSKVYAHWATVNAREAHGMHASCGILFNHESPLRGTEFVTRKITTTLADIHAGHKEELVLGNLDAARDWGYAQDYVRGMWQMLQQPDADDYLLATGESHTVREFVEFAADAAGFDIEWEGEGVDAKGIDRRTGNTLVRVSPEFYRPAEVDALEGDASKARTKLGWAPEVSFKSLIHLMMEADLRRAENGPIPH